MKKVFSFILVLLCTLTLGFSTGQKEASASETSSVTLEILSLKNEQGPQDALNEIIANFTKNHPGVSVDIQTMNSDNLKTTMRARAASNDMPDIITWMKEIEPEYMYDLSSESFIGNLEHDSVAAANAIYDNATYAMPIDNGYIGMYYNKDVLAANGLTVPTTVSELRSDCEILKANGIPPFATGCLDLSVPYVGLISLFAETVYGRNPNWSAERDAGRHTIETDAGWKQAFDLTKEFLYGYSDKDNTFNMGYDDANAALALGKSAFLGQGSWALSGIRNTKEDANIGLAAFPISENPEDAKLLVFPDTSFSILKDTKHLAIAKEFLAYLASPEAGEIWARNVRVSSTVKGVNVDFDPIAGDINEYVNSGNFTPYGDRVLRSVFTDKLWETFSQYMLGLTEWKPFAQTLDEFWNKAVTIDN